MKNSILSMVCLGWMQTAPAADLPWPEHPRPDFERPAWVNLNGPWQFEFDPDDIGLKQQWFVPGRHEFKRRITVPFPWESRLSGIGDTQYQGTAWYSRRFNMPAGGEWQDRDTWLVIGACDWEAKVWVNGRLAREHAGGYVPFEVDLSQFAEPGEQVTITIRIVDRTDHQQPTGKQIGWYTRTSGLWQTVYLEPRGRTYIRSFRSMPDVRAGSITYKVSLNQAGTAQRLTLHSPDAAFEPVTIDVPAAAVSVEATVKVHEPRLWTPDSPALYPIVLELSDPNGLTDRVRSYFGLREISVGKAPGREYQYIRLNGKPIYLRGALHQSFHPDGIYQYPDDAAMRSDYELCKRIGLNFLRIHIKAPVPRELYWADRLGVLIMQDMPNFWKHSERARCWWRKMLEAVIQRDANHPAIFAWCDFNETWGIGDGGYDAGRQQWVEDMYHLTRRLDPTRLCEDNSPCRYDHVATDINSWHFYLNDYATARAHIREVVQKTHPGSTFNYVGGRKQDNAPLINSEYGGISAGKGDQDISWCFKYLTNELRLHDKIGGYVYTELSDIEWEHNGFVNYDRTPKQYGYDFWHPGFTLKDLNSPDFVVIDAPPMIELEPGSTREVPIKISHFSDHEADSLTLRWRLDWLDRLGRRSTGQWQSRPAAWKPFAVLDQPPITIAAQRDGPTILGALLVEVVDHQTTLARNYVNLLVDRGPAPRLEAAGADTLLLRFSPADFAAWTFTGPIPIRQGVAAHKVAGHRSGAVEYHLQLAEQVNLDQISELTILAELAGKADDEKLDWPARKKPLDYPQTDATKWPTDVTLSINGVKLAQSTLPDDPADARGALSHHHGHPGSYGYLVTETVQGPALQRVLSRLGDDRILRVRWEVPAGADHPGGLAVFGEDLGAYPVSPTVRLVFRKPHGLAGTFTSDRPVAINRMVDRVENLIPTAEQGKYLWHWTTARPPDNWTEPAFDHRDWPAGQGGFGRAGTPNSIINTKWTTSDIWLRTVLTIDDPSAIEAAYWRLHHDEDTQIYVNGRKVLALKGFVTQYVDLPLDQAALTAFRPGENVIAVHCHQTGGGQNLDLGLTIARNSAKAR